MDWIIRGNQTGSKRPELVSDREVADHLHRQSEESLHIASDTKQGTNPRLPIQTLNSLRIQVDGYARLLGKMKKEWRGERATWKLVTVVQRI